MLHVMAGVLLQCAARTGYSDGTVGYAFSQRSQSLRCSMLPVEIEQAVAGLLVPHDLSRLAGPDAEQAFPNQPPLAWLQWAALAWHPSLSAQALAWLGPGWMGLVGPGQKGPSIPSCASTHACRTCSTCGSSRMQQRLSLLGQAPAVAAHLAVAARAWRCCRSTACLRRWRAC